MSLSNFPNGISSMGIPLVAGVPTSKGNVFFVDYGAGNDSNSGTDTKNAFKTIEYALSRCVTNNYDVIVLMGSSAHALSAMLDVSINRVSIVGLDGSLNRRYGQRQRITLGVTTAATDLAVMQNTGVGNVFTNIKFDSSNTVDESLYAVVEAGEYAEYNNCEIYKSTDLDVTGAAELVCNGDSAQFNNCYIGSTANAISGAIIRPCVLLTREIVSGKVCRDVSFRNCIFARKCGHADNNFIYGLNAASVERMLLIENCTFWNAKLGTAPDEAIEFGADQTDGSVFVKDSYALNVTGIASTGQGVYGNNAAAATTSNIALALT